MPFFALNDENSVSAIVEASFNGHEDVVQLLLEDERVDPSADSNSALVLASQEGHLEIVELLLGDPRTDPADGNNSALRQAAENGHRETVLRLLKDPRVSLDDAIEYSKKSNSASYVKRVLQIYKK